MTPEGFSGKFLRLLSPVTDANEPKKETVRIGLPTQPATKPPRTDAKSRETVRIQLPIRPPSTKLPLGSPAEQSPLQNLSLKIQLLPQLSCSRQRSQFL